MASAARYAPDVYKALNGVFCIFKPEGQVWQKVRDTIQLKLSRELNSMECRPPRKLVKFVENEDGLSPIVTTVPDLADHPLAVGQRYEPKDFHLTSTDNLAQLASGVQLVCIGHGSSWLKYEHEARHTRVYHVKGQFGLATDNYFHTGRIREKTTYHHIRQGKVDQTLTALQAANQRTMFLASGLDMQSEEAYELAVKGLFRPKPVGAEAGTVIYGIRCIEFDLPNFTLEIHCSNEKTAFLMRLIHKLGLVMKSTATCTQLRRIRFGNFTLDNALVQSVWDSGSIMDSISQCRDILKSETVKYNRVLSHGTNTRMLPCIES